MITLVGTGHVFDLRVRLQREVLARAPDVVCLELDPGRLRALLAKQRGGGSGDVPLTYRLLADFQNKLAEDRGIVPGDEMLAAYEAAAQARIPVALIDVDAQAAFKKLWTTMGLGEKARFLGSAVAAAVLPGKYVEKELEQLKGDYSGLLEQLGKEYPTVKRVLLDERNEHMAAKLRELRAQGKERIVAIIGDGHVDGIRGLLDQHGLGAEVEVLRLKDLHGEGPPPASGASFSFRTEVQG